MGQKKSNLPLIFVRLAQASQHVLITVLAFEDIQRCSTVF